MSDLRMRTRSPKNTKGAILISVMIILLTIGLVGASLVELFTVITLSTQSIGDKAKSLYLAEAGISHAIHILRGQAGSKETSEGILGPFKLGDGTYTIEIILEQSLIVARGDVNGTKKTLQFQFRPL